MKMKNWVLIDENEYWIERELADGVFEYYKAVCGCGDGKEWAIAHSIMDVNNETWAEAALRPAWGDDWKRMQARYNFIHGSDPALICENLAYPQCCERIKDISGIENPLH